MQTTNCDIECIIVTRYIDEPPSGPLLLNKVLYNTWLNLKTGQKLYWNGTEWIEENIQAREEGP